MEQVTVNPIMLVVPLFLGQAFFKMIDNGPQR